ncbi:hypothetical protein [Rhodococcus sp. LW-XY12]|uniref:hypothetical protein n=1 Tax=Rhodococcus sp. LW-XY12 TaxID=2856851 RepID=UPI001C5779FE|nr:hypothetical protein [Rhodococcus sp. LW-XY12]QXU53633.1 hypothetical protein KXC42_23395 [Rhodococcus sp. LW-XY12]
MTPPRDLADAQTRIDELEEQLAVARATNQRLNRRCQIAEKAAHENIDACRRAGQSLGRGLANLAALSYSEKLDEIRSYAERIRTDDIDAVELPEEPTDALVSLAIYATATGIGDRILMILDGKADR